jgi:hypothetical protein
MRETIALRKPLAMKKVDSVGWRVLQSLKQALEWSAGKRRARVNVFRRADGKLVREVLFCTGPEYKAIQAERKPAKR